MVVAHIERKPERLCAGDEFQEVSYVVQKGLRARRHLKDIRLFNLKRRVFDLAGLRNGRKDLARSRCSPTNTIVKKRFLCYVSSSFPTQNKMSN